MRPSRTARGSAAAGPASKPSAAARSNIGSARAMRAHATSREALRGEQHARLELQAVGALGERREVLVELRQVTGDRPGALVVEVFGVDGGDEARDFALEHLH